MDSTAEPQTRSGKTAVVVMGVAGSGKSTVADLFAQQLGWSRIEGDDLHPAENVARMAAGTPLTDADREPWLRLICQRIDRTEGNQVITCSALRRGYRDILRTAEARVRFLHLSGSTELLAARIGARTDHFMPPKLLTSQLDALEPLTPDEDGVVVDVEGTPADIVARALQALDLHKPSAFHQGLDTKKALVDVDLGANPLVLGRVDSQALHDQFHATEDHRRTHPAAFVLGTDFNRAETHKVDG